MRFLPRPFSARRGAPRKGLSTALPVLLMLLACQSEQPAAAAPAPAVAKPASTAPATSAATAAASATPSNATQAPNSAALSALLPPYLTIQAALAGDSTQGVAAAAKDLADAARAAGQPALADAAARVGSAPDLKAARDAFKAVSNPIADWTLADNTTKGQYTVIHCSMAPGSWVQKDKAVRNPYYGKEMLTCGDLRN